MIITPDRVVRFMTVAEHLERKAMIYQDPQRTIYLHSNKNFPFVMAEGAGEDVYIDLFALKFGQKEQLRKKTGKGMVQIRYGCPRAERDKIFFLPVEEVIDERSRHRCPYNECQYWSNPTGVKGQYAMNCILVRYRALGVLDQKVGLTLEEVSRIYACTRERIRQIQDRAIQRLRHQTRLNQVKIFHEHIPDYRDFSTPGILEVA
ncbi:hypothetical protein GF339_09650 [candidate division KSB3 bacterium]|uniref:RNA polymerase sigma-70 region 4 domain-containing protein n=1 Tax=candidate division KSB3 bacterium TaxID=2044937 RepID=A0A9D5Q627_9BACT|nr:hypothetical protein [candidate division KSB3 bacterium]MBD3324837.1 hypothetical protein [candidate division KSB3 bacterium]